MTIKPQEGKINLTKKGDLLRKAKIMPLLIIIFLFQKPAPAEATVGEKLIGVTVKGIAKLVVTTTDIDKAKKRFSDKLRDMDNEKFRVKYARLYEVIKDLPGDLKTVYRITPDMTKEQMIKNIESVNSKKEMYRTINRIPDRTIKELLKLYLANK